ncbi:MAG: HEAT repeat domain-containing protein [Planctomycetes bacterium]|nr:HEAT repeat domain-containing protein [Planctomycetota bacterium]
MLKALGSPEPDVRVGAARALGYIGFQASVEALVRETTQADDWQLASACVEALGRLRAEQAIPALNRAAANYWYLPVRSAARGLAVGCLTVLPGEERGSWSWAAN